MNYVQGDTLRVEDFEAQKVSTHIDIETFSQSISEIDNPIESIKQMAERKLILDVLNRCGNNKAQAARLLKVSRPLLYQKMKRLNIEP